MGYGFKNYDELVFGNNQTDMSPFTQQMWDLVMTWYWRIAGIIGGPILIAIVILAWKMIIAGISPDKRSEVKDNLMRLFFGAATIGIAPVFIKFLLLINNSLVKLLVANAHGNLNDLLGNSVISNINTGNAIATAIVIALFAYLFALINIKFIIRQFTIIVFTIFTPIVSVFWIMNKRTIASSLWFGVIIVNIFMQFIYAFLFLIYMDFLPKTGGWGISILWAMMILPLASALQNTMQNLVSRIAGIDNTELATRGIGMASAMGYTLKAFTYQFKTEHPVNEEDSISKDAKKVTSNKEKPMPSKNYEEHSRDIMDNAKPLGGKRNKNEKEKTNRKNSLNSEKLNNKNINNNSTYSKKGTRKAYNVGKEFINLGMYAAEGRNFRNNDYTNKNRKNPRTCNYKKSNMNDTTKEDKKKEIRKIITQELEDDANG